MISVAGQGSETHQILRKGKRGKDTRCYSILVFTSSKFYRSLASTGEGVKNCTVVAFQVKNITYCTTKMEEKPDYFVLALS